jgi:hypothetical protein
MLNFGNYSVGRGALAAAWRTCFVLVVRGKRGAPRLQQQQQILWALFLKKNLNN